MAEHIEPAPGTVWALLVEHDREHGSSRLAGLYATSDDAILDSAQLQNEGHWVEVVAVALHHAPQWSAIREPVTERTDDDFDTVVPAAE